MIQFTGEHLLCEFEWHSMPDMHAVTTRAPAGVQEERLAFLMPIQDDVQFAMAEDDSSAHEAMRAMASNSLEAFQQLVAEQSCAEFLNQLVIVHR